MADIVRNGITIRVASADESAKETVTSSVLTVDSRIGRTHKGKVVSFKPYGFFVETDDGHFGLVHGKNISGWRWGMRFDRVFRFGSEIEVKVVDVEPDTDRMSFSCELPDDVQAETEETVAAEPAEPPPKTREEIAAQWIEEHPEASEAAREWLRNELNQGPIYGPLTSVINDRFGVPTPVSYWIRNFSEFACYSGRGDNPSDLPAVALVSRAQESGYWDAIKRSARDLSKEEGPLERLTAFPGSAWIADFGETARLLGAGAFGSADVLERLVLPLLGQLGWDVSPTNAALVRGGSGEFSVRIFADAAERKAVSLAISCAPTGVSFAAEDVERMLALANRLANGTEAHIAWTNGLEWIVFPRALLSAGIGILADHRGAAVFSTVGKPGDSSLRRVELPVGEKPFAWLTTFAELHALIGC